MKYAQHIAGVVLAATLAVPAAAHAAGLTVVFEQTPLFAEVNIAPGLVTTRTMDVHNADASAQELFIETLNVTDADNFGAALNLTIADGTTVHYDGSLAALFSGSRESLGSIAAGATSTYSLSVAFATSSVHHYQGATLAFDICIGFSGGSLLCDGSTVSTPPATGGGGGGGGGGAGGGGIITQTLQIFNESGTVVPPTAGLIVWQTNLPATTQVVYGAQTGGPYPLDLNSPTFGYPLATGESSARVTNHAVTLPALTPGETYVFRVVSRESPTSAPTVSPEYTLVVAPSAPFANTTAPAAAGDGDALLSPEAPDADADAGTLPAAAPAGADTQEAPVVPPANAPAESPTEAEPENEEALNNNQVAAAFMALPDELWRFLTSLECIAWFVLGLFVAVFAAAAASRVPRWALLSPHARRVRQGYVFAGVITAQLGAAIAFSQSCLVAPLAIVAVATLVWLLVYSVRTTRA